VSKRKKGNPQVEQSWGEVKQLGEVITQGLVKFAHSAKVTVDRLNGYPVIFEDPIYRATVKTLKTDLDVCTDALIELKSTYSDKRGVIKEPEELMECHRVFSELSDFWTTTSSLIAPHLITLTERLTTADELDREVAHG
jgi:hypothetical protein